MADVRQLLSICEGRTVYIQTHNFPDPDAIGTAFGLQRLLLHFHIPSKICYEGRIDKLSTSKMLDLFHIQIYSYAEIRPELTEGDYIICVDSQKGGGNITDFVGDEIASIDHHPTYVQVEYQYADLQIVGACATLIAEYYQDLGLTPDRDTASALLYGIKMDTMQFTRGVTERDIAAFAFLFPLADQDAMSTLNNSTLEFSDLQAYGAAIEGIQLYGYLGLSRIPFSCPDAMIAILSDFILSLVEVEVAVIYCERKDGLKLSIRSERSDVHAGTLTRRALQGLGDGGGHAAMAGGLIPRDRFELLGRYPDDTLRNAFLNALDEQLKE